MTPQDAQNFIRLFTFSSKPQRVNEAGHRGWTSFCARDLANPDLYGLVIPNNHFVRSEEGINAWIEALGEFAYNPNRQAPGGYWIIYVDQIGLRNLAEKAVNSGASSDTPLGGRYSIINNPQNPPQTTR